MPTLSRALGGGDSDVNIRIQTQADNKGSEDAASGLKRAGDQADDTGKKFDQFGKVAAIAVTAVATAAVGFAVASVKAFQESEEVVAQTQAVLKSTGEAAGVTADQVGELATELQKVTRFSDETIQAGENMLLTFTNIGKDVFPDATKTMLDMSQALGQDVKNSAIQLGKALNDPITGVTALRRVGVTFTDSQQDQIKTLVESGKTMEAQRLVLAELSKEFGGSAVAAGETFGGQLDRMNNQLGQVQETVGELIVRGIAPVTLGILDWIDSMGGVEGIAENVESWLGDMGEAFMEVYNPIAEYLGPKLEELWKSINESLLPALENLWHNVLEPLIPVIGIVLVGAIGLAVDALTTIFNWIGWVSTEIENGNPIVIGLAVAFGTLAAAMAFSAVFSALQAGFGLLTATTIPAVMGKITALRTLIMSPVGMGSILVAGALADIALVMEAVVAVQNAIQAMNDAAAAKKNLDKTNQDLRNAASKAYAAGDKAKGDKFTKLANEGNPEAPSWFDQFMTGTLGKFSSGGYTGQGGTYEPAGIVHKGEYVVPKDQVDQRTGLPKMSQGSRTTYTIGQVVLSTAEATREFFSIQDRDQFDVRQKLTPSRGQ